jgi:hypothetical protein
LTHREHKLQTYNNLPKVKLITIFPQYNLLLGCPLGNHGMVFVQ